MRAVIIGNGEIKNYEYIKSKLNDDDFIICADGGTRHIKLLDVSADVVIGDFDSSDKCDNVKTYVYPAQKDYTDGELAVSYALQNGYKDILMLAMTGKRLDHTLTNIIQLSKHNKISLIDDDNEIYCVKEKLEIANRKGKTLSIIPVYQDLKGVKTTGLLYPLNDETLYFGSGRGNSNIITDDICTVSVSDGMGIVLINNGE